MKIKFRGQYSYIIVIGNNQRILLKPGQNYVSDEEWNQVKENPLVKERITKGDIIIISKKDITETDSDDEIDLSKMNVKDATEFVKSCTDIEMLQELLEKEERKSLKKVIEEQIENLEEIEEIED